MYKVEYLPLAVRDLKEIAIYIAEVLCSPNTAERLTSDIVAACESLSSMPYRHRVYASIRPLKHEFRALRVDSYLVFYWVDEEEETVIAARVIYRRSDVPSKLNLQ